MRKPGIATADVGLASCQQESIQSTFVHAPGIMPVHIVVTNQIFMNETIERITDTVMQTAVLSPGQAGNQIAYLRDQGLPESSGSDNRSTGDEPSSLFEGSTNELEDAAPSNTDIANQPTKVEKAAEAVGMDDSGDLSTGSGAVELTDCDETRDDDPLAVGGIDEQLRNSGHQPQEQHAETVVDSRIFDASETVSGFSK